MTVDNENVLTKAIREHLRQGRLTQVRPILELWLKQSSMATPRALQALLRLAEGNLEAAAAAALKAVALDSKHWMAYIALAQVYLAQGRNEDAFHSAERAFHLKPDDVEGANLYAQLLLKNGQIQLAERVLRQGALEDETDPRARLLLAEILLNHRQTELAEVLMLVTDACNKAPYMASAWALRGLALAAAGDIRAGRDFVELALLLEPDFPPLLMTLAQLELASGEPVALEQAVRHARRAAALAPHEWRATLLVAEALRAKKQYGAALKALSTAAESFPGIAEIQITIALLCALDGDFESGLVALANSEALGASQVIVLGVRSELAMRSGDIAGALVAFEHYDLLTRGDEKRLPVSGAEANQTIGFIANGLGEYLTYIRFLPEFRQRFRARVKLAAPASIASFLARASAVDEVSVDEAIAAHWVEPILRLPALIGWHGDNRPLFTEPYLSAQPLKMEDAHLRRLAHEGPCVLIDLGEDTDDFLVREIVSHIVLANALIIAPESCSILLERYGGELNKHIISMEDLEEQSAWASVADAIIVGDVPLAQLVGALGVYAYVFLPLGHSALWGCRNHTPWYPTLHLLREPRQGGWVTASAEINSTLERIFVSARQTHL